MPKVKCDCGNIIGLGQIPSPNQLLIISDIEYDKFSGQVDAEDIYREMRIVVECNNCGRIHIYWNGFDKTPITYQREFPPFERKADI